MTSVNIKKKNGSFLAENKTFILEINQNGWIKTLNVKNKSIELTKNETLYVKSNQIKPDRPYINTLSSVITAEFDTDFGSLNRIYTIKENAFTIDDVVVSSSKVSFYYTCIAGFTTIFDYFMVGKKRFNLNETKNLEGDDLLLVNEKEDLYLGCVFKNKMNIHYKNENDLMIFQLNLNIDLMPADMFLFSYNFSLV